MVRRDPRHLGLFLTHRGELVNYANGIVGDHARAEDVVQEAYLRFDAASEKLLDEPVGYLYRIVRNLALDNRRQQVREARYFVREDGAGELTAEDRPSPEAEATAKDEMRAMRAAMAKLPERSRIALEMYCFGNCKLKDIAAYLGISVGLAHALVVDGLDHCRTRLGRPSS
ncbi:MAG TPA: sigma-70 family RNA polymerase sigma factor [Stellaceae bacterium]|nr:sigma-70 family RNA polymerase sigma factor [Stellaceae bacterium]